MNAWKPRMKQHNAGSLGKITDMPSQTLRNQLQCTFLSSMTGGQSADCSKTWACATGSTISWRAWPRTGPVLPGTWTQTFRNALLTSLIFLFIVWASTGGTGLSRSSTGVIEANAERTLAKRAARSPACCRKRARARPRVHEHAQSHAEYDVPRIT